MKRFFAFLLTLAMVVSLLPAGTVVMATDDDGVSTGFPELTLSSVTRYSDEAHAIFKSSVKTGTYYYQVVESEVPVPEIDTSGTGKSFNFSVLDIQLKNLEDKKYTLYVVIKDESGSFSEVKMATIPQTLEGLTYHLSSNSNYDITVPTGTVITVSFVVENQSDAEYTLSRLQNEIYYDHTFFEFVENSGTLDENRLVDCSVQTYSTGEHRVYVNHIVDKTYSANQFVASFQLRVLATEEGSSSIIETKAQKATKNMGTVDGVEIMVDYVPIEEKNLTVRIGNPVVAFDSMGGSAIEPASVEYGESVAAPENPIREGYTFAGWYTSEDNGATLSETAYDFNSPVTSSFTLYAKWQKDPSPAASAIVWVGGQGMTASTDGSVVSYYTNGTDGAAGTVTQIEPNEYHAKLYYDTTASTYTLMGL